MLGRKLAAPRLLLELPAGRTKPINYIPGGATFNVPNNFSASTQIDLSHGVVSDKSPGDYLPHEFGLKLKAAGNQLSGNTILPM